MWTLAQLQNMTANQISSLSPAEKLDIFAGRFDYPTVNSEWQRTSPQDAQWEGLCHGWAPASQFYLQPEPVNMTSKDQLIIPDLFLMVRSILLIQNLVII